MSDPVTRVKDIIGVSWDDDFLSYDLTEIQNILNCLKHFDSIDLAHAEMLQQQALRGADILSEYLSRMVKTVSHLENKLNSVKNKTALDYQAPNGARTTLDMKKWASETAPEVEEIANSLAQARGTKSLLEKKYDLMIKTHHHYKEIASGLRRTILGYSTGTPETKKVDGWE